MAEQQVLKTIFQLKRGKAKAWSSVNPILMIGEPGYETDTGKMKIGDGVSDWNNLRYLSDDEFEAINQLKTTVTEMQDLIGSETENTGLYALINEKANANNVYTKNEIDNLVSGVYSYKGTVKYYTDLPTENLKIGDVYNVESSSLEYGILSGDNVVWNGHSWDKLAGVVDLSNYATKQEVKEDLLYLLTQSKNIFERKKFEILDVPEGTLIAEKDGELRVMVPENAEFIKQQVGSNGNPNMYYMQFRAYAPEDAVSFKEGDRGEIIDKMFTFDDDFAGTDKFGRNYSVCWLALASYDADSDAWTYFGKNSSVEKYIGWTYVVEWYDKNGVIISSDKIRINLANEDCYNAVEPYYVHSIIESANAYTDEQIKKLPDTTGIEIIEF